MKTCFITGANSGIGRAAALQLSRRGYRVLLGCRNRERGEAALEDVKAASPESLGDLVIVDMASAGSVRRAASEVGRKADSLDVLIHNAADFDLSRTEPVFSPEGIETVWAANHLGPVLLTDLLLESLKRAESGRIIMVASQGLVMHPRLKVNLEDPEFRRRRYSVAAAYYQSKLAHLMYSYHLAGELSGSGITVNCVRVTNVKVDPARYPNLPKVMKLAYSLKSRFSISPEQMAEVYTWLADDPDLKDVSGGYFNEKRQRVSSSSYSREAGEIRRVMKLTREYLNKEGTE